MSIFEQIDPPRKQSRLVINRQASWHTWSPEFRSVCRSLNKQLDTLETPKALRLLGGKEYDETFSAEIFSLSDKNLALDLMSFANDLYHLRVSGEIMSFHNLLDESFCGRGLHLLFALFRSALVHITKDPLSALSQPLHRQYKEPRDFPLHADLYIPKILFNVFEEVPDDSSGASTFLSVPIFIQMLDGIKSLEDNVRREMINLITETHRKDRYEEFYRLLHAEGNNWKEELGERMKARQLKIKLYAGQGYLIHDRTWLHGREAPSGGITRKRFHRLIFNTKYIH